MRIDKKQGIIEVCDFNDRPLYRKITNQPVITGRISPNSTYIVIHDQRGWHLYHPNDPDWVWDMPSENEPVISPNDAYCFAWHEYRGGRLYSLNLFHHAQPTFVELFALVLLIKQKGIKETSNDQLSQILDSSDNVLVNHISQWLCCERIVCDLCKQHVPEIECMLPCGHAQFHEKCLESWRKINQNNSCSLCMFKENFNNIVGKES